MNLPPDWSELIESLLSHRVRFLVVGAHALAAHGRPRATQALDLFVDPTESNAQRLGAALFEFGYPGLARTVEKVHRKRPDGDARAGTLAHRHHDEHLRRRFRPRLETSTSRAVWQAHRRLP